MTVTPIAARHRPGHIMGGGTYWITRLNNLLRFQHADLRTLNNGAFENLVDDIYFAIFGEKRDRDPSVLFNQLATRPNVIEAQEGLRRLINIDVDESDPKVEIELERQTLEISVDEGGYYRGRFTSKHFPTNVYMTFNHLLQASEVWRSDFLTCANDKCQQRFVPLRKPRNEERAFCSARCRNRVAAIEYRRQKADELKEKERIRSQKRYAAKVAAKFPNAKVKRKKKKPK